MAIRTWTRRMQAEVEQLPETLATLRESADNIRRVSEDLTGVAASLRRITEALDAAGLVETTEVMKRSGDALRQSAASMESVQRSFVEANGTFFAGLAKLPGADLFGGFRRPR